MLSRRELLRILPSGAAACLGCAGLALCTEQSKGQSFKDQPATQAASLGFSANADMTWEQAFNFRYQGYARLMRKLSSRIGRDRFLEMLRKASSEVASEYSTLKAKSEPGRDLENFIVFFTTELMPRPIYRSALVWEIAERSEKALEIRVSRCLWAKTFRAEDAAEIGYASVCYADYAGTTAMNPKIKLIRTKTLMQGHDCCNHRWVVAN